MVRNRDCLSMDEVDQLLKGEPCADKSVSHEDWAKAMEEVLDEEKMHQFAPDMTVGEFKAYAQNELKRAMKVAESYQIRANSWAQVCAVVDRIKE